MNIQEIKVPDIGNYSGVEVIEVAITVGDTVKAEDTLVTLETEKAAMDVPSPIQGTIKEVKLKTGDKVSQGDVIALIEIATTTEVATPAAVSTETKSNGSAAAISPVSVAATEEDEDDEAFTADNVHAGPATRRLARELGVDLSQIRGTGHKQRIITKDVHAFVKSLLQNKNTSGGSLGLEPAPEVDFSQFGEIEVKALSRIKKWTAKNLHRNWVSIPHVTQFDEADISALEAFRVDNKQISEAKGVKLTPMAFIIKAVVSALQTYPQFNASLASNGTDLVLKKYFHIGVAVDTPEGLMVPVLKDADKKGLLDIAKELGELSTLAREGKLKAAQMQGSCFSITSLGAVRGTAFTPIINAPDVAILGVSRAQVKPVYKDDQLQPARMLPLSLSYDHRVIDGVEAAKFLGWIAEQLQDIRKLLL